MHHKKTYKYVIVIIFLAIITECGILKIVSDSEKISLLSEDNMFESEFREQNIGDEMLHYIGNKDICASEIAVYLLECKLGYKKYDGIYSEKAFLKAKLKWMKQEGWNVYYEQVNAIWNDLKYFPIPKSTTDQTLKVTFENSWMFERNYGGTRGHEGTDIMASKNVAGLYPVVSMTDGIIRSKGWLEKGGWRIGVEAPLGAYFYYAHLDSYASVNIGDEIKAGELIGFMGDSGYGEEGTKGKFPVHLHVGIYIYPSEKEMSINPYWILRYLEKHYIKCAYSYGDI